MCIRDRIKEYTDKGLNHQPSEIRFVTWTLKYSKCHWLQVLGLEKHYARAEISARLKDDAIEVDEPKNITRFSVLPLRPKLRIGEIEIKLPEGETARVISRTDKGWALSSEPLAGKRPGLQGPIDDAFTERFLCVRGTGKPWNEATQKYADASLKRFAEE